MQDGPLTRQQRTGFACVGTGGMLYLRTNPSFFFPPPSQSHKIRNPFKNVGGIIRMYSMSE